MSLALFIIPFSLINYLLIFLLFRIFDILKPSFIYRLQSLPNGCGIILDDIFAGIFASILGILWLSTVPLTNGIISDIFGQGYVTTLFGIAILSHNIGSFLGSWIGGRIYDLYGSYDPVWWICVLLGFASAAINYPINIRPVNRLQQTKS